MWSQVLDRNSRRGMSALDSAQVIRCGNTLPKWIADTSKNQPSNPNNSPRQPNFAIGSTDQECRSARCLGSDPRLNPHQRLFQPARATTRSTGDPPCAPRDLPLREFALAGGLMSCSSSVGYVTK